ncbi:MAG: pilus assembly protein TadG-related protein, partial [Thermodesulfobacteriota bacterium]
MKYLHRQRGSASVFVLVSCLVLFVVLALVGDVARLYAVKVSARHALNLALR